MNSLRFLEWTVFFPLRSAEEMITPRLVVAVGYERGGRVEWRSFDSVASLPRSGHSTRAPLAEGHERACRQAGESNGWGRLLLLVYTWSARRSASPPEVS